MKLSILCLVLVALGLSLSASSTATSQAASARTAIRLDDPPPEPVECPMCGGNATVHMRRMLLIQLRVNRAALLATRW